MMQPPLLLFREPTHLANGVKSSPATTAGHSSAAPSGVHTVLNATHGLVPHDTTSNRAINIPATSLEGALAPSHDHEQQEKTVHEQLLSSLSHVDRESPPGPTGALHHPDLRYIAPPSPLITALLQGNQSGRFEASKPDSAYTVNHLFPRQRVLSTAISRRNSQGSSFNSSNSALQHQVSHPGIDTGGDVTTPQSLMGDSPPSSTSSRWNRKHTSHTLSHSAPHRPTEENPLLPHHGGLDTLRAPLLVPLLTNPYSRSRLCSSPTWSTEPAPVKEILRPSGSGARVATRSRTPSFHQHILRSYRSINHWRRGSTHGGDNGDYANSPMYCEDGQPYTADFMRHPR